MGHVSALGGSKSGVALQFLSNLVTVYNNSKIYSPDIRSKPRLCNVRGGISSYHAAMKKTSIDTDQTCRRLISRAVEKTAFISVPSAKIITQPLALDIDVST